MHGGLRAVLEAELRKNVPDVRLDGLLGAMESSASIFLFERISTATQGMKRRIQNPRSRMGFPCFEAFAADTMDVSIGRPAARRYPFLPRLLTLTAREARPPWRRPPSIR